CSTRPRWWRAMRKTRHAKPGLWESLAQQLGFLGISQLHERVCGSRRTVMATFTWKSLTSNVLEGYVREDRPNQRVILFVHGFGGDFKTTWRAMETSSLFHDFIKDDPELSDFDVLTFGYKSGVWGGPSIKNIAVALKNQIEQHLVGRHIVLAAHSMGGLVCMRYILDLLENERPLPVTGLIL